MMSKSRPERFSIVDFRRRCSKRRYELPDNIAKLIPRARSNKSHTQNRNEYTALQECYGTRLPAHPTLTSAHWGEQRAVTR